MQCPNCNAELTEIIAEHTYAIEYSEEQGRWTKSTGDVEYRCAICTDELSTTDIEDILKQVDEL